MLKLIGMGSSSAPGALMSTEKFQPKEGSKVAPFVFNVTNETIPGNQPRLYYTIRILDTEDPGGPIGIRNIFQQSRSVDGKPIWRSGAPDIMEDYMDKEIAGTIATEFVGVPDGKGGHLAYFIENNNGKEMFLGKKGSWTNSYSTVLFKRDNKARVFAGQGFEILTEETAPKVRAITIRPRKGMESLIANAAPAKEAGTAIPSAAKAAVATTETGLPEQAGG